MGLSGLSSVEACPGDELGSKHNIGAPMLTYTILVGS